MKKIISLNVFDKELQICSESPLTGFYRDGCCTSSDQDKGEHRICAIMTRSFLEFSFQRGNDLITPNNIYGFPGLKDGDRWCLCSERWLESQKKGYAPKILLRSTNKLVLNKIDIEILKKFALDIS